MTSYGMCAPCSERLQGSVGALGCGVEGHMVQGGTRAETGRMRGCPHGQEKRTPTELTIPTGAKVGGGIFKELRSDEEGTWRQ